MRFKKVIEVFHSRSFTWPTLVITVVVIACYRKYAKGRLDSTEDVDIIFHLSSLVVDKVASEENDIRNLLHKHFNTAFHRGLVEETAGMNIRNLCNAHAIERLGQIAEIHSLSANTIIVRAADDTIGHRSKR